MSQLLMTKEMFEAIPHGIVFRTVVTHIQTVHEPFEATLKFVCKKGDIGIDWAIYCHTKEKPDEWVKAYGDKVQSEENIRSICPCDDDVYKMYRH